ncbi:MAG: hypothetical protein ACT4P2_05190 [Pseudomonadota bacterium]
MRRAISTALRLALLVAPALTLHPVAASAQSVDPSGPGQLRSTAYADMPAGLAIAVRPLDNSPTNLRLKSSFISALGRRALGVKEPPARLVLNFETEVQQTGRRADGPSLGEVRGDRHDQEVRLNVWSTTRDSLLLGRQSQGTGATGVRYVLTATLDESGGRRLWQGEVSYDGGPPDEFSALSALVPILVDEIGNTVRHRGFRLE